NGNMTTDRNKGITSIAYNPINLPTRVVFENLDPQYSTTWKAITYTYDATGVKLQKTVQQGSIGSHSTTHTKYATHYIYVEDATGETLTFFSHPEGYVEPNTGNGYDYVYQYKDHLGNIRLSYKNTGTGSSPNLEILEENNYYPFGLEHKGYNNVVNGQEYKYKTFQGQERHDELGLNWLSFKYRFYDPAMARFFNVDPLAEDYVYNGVYNFAENRVIDGIELEGLEWKSIKDEDAGTTKIQLTIQLYNDSSLSESKLNDRVEAMKTQFADSYSGEGFTGELVVNTVTEAKGDFLVKVTDNKSTTVTKKDGTTVTRKVNGSAPGSLKNVNTQASSDKSTVRI